MKRQIRFFAITLVLPIVGFCQNNFSVGGNSLSLESQSISIGIGPIYTLTNQSVRMINSKDDFQNTDYAFNISYEHTLNFKNISIIGNYINYKGYTFIKFRKGSVIAPDGFPVLGDGFSGVNLNRIDVLINYNLREKYRRFYLKIFLGVGAQISKKNGQEFYSEIFKFNGPEYFELEPLSVISLNTFQIVPSLGIKVGYLFWKRVEISFVTQGVYAFKTYQKMFFKYSYKGAPQETAVFEGRGTGIYTSLGIGYRFKKVGKKKTGDYNAYHG